MATTVLQDTTSNKLPSTNAVNKELNLELEERIPQMRPCHYFGYQTPMRLAIDGQAADFANKAMK